MRMQNVRFGVISFIVMCIVAAAGVAVLQANLQTHKLQDGGDKELVTFTLTWRPTERYKEIQISLEMSGRKPIVDKTKQSPWIRQELLPRGTTVVLNGFQAELGELKCLIRRGSVTVSGPWNIGTFGTVECKGVV